MRKLALTLFSALIAVALVGCATPPGGAHRTSPSLASPGTVATSPPKKKVNWGQILGAAAVVGLAAVAIDNARNSSSYTPSAPATTYSPVASYTQAPTYSPVAPYTPAPATFQPLSYPNITAPRVVSPTMFPLPKLSSPSTISSPTNYSRSRASGNVRSQNLGNFTYYNGDNGYSGTSQRIGNFDHFNDNRGNSLTSNRIGNFTYHNGNNGYSGTSQRIGNFRYFTDNQGNSVTSQRIGNFIHHSGSDGYSATTSRIGNQLYTY